MLGLGFGYVEDQASEHFERLTDSGILLGGLYGFLVRSCALGSGKGLVGVGWGVGGEEIQLDVAAKRVLEALLDKGLAGKVVGKIQEMTVLGLKSDADVVAVQAGGLGPLEQASEVGVAVGV